ncbi:MAG TPA: hypothetical protein VFP77_13540 [Gemmatimonadaceae bacterium]|nr:hypothetical protein [Gemmatimonadaceae bacterium]
MRFDVRTERKPIAQHRFQHHSDLRIACIIHGSTRVDVKVIRVSPAGRAQYPITAEAKRLRDDCFDGDTRCVVAGVPGTQLQRPWVVVWLYGDRIERLTLTGDEGAAYEYAERGRCY